MIKHKTLLLCREKHMTFDEPECYERGERLILGEVKWNMNKF